MRSVGRLRQTGHEADRELHLALNAGIPLADPKGGFYFVFMAGPPAFRKYDASGELVYERAIQGREIDPVIAAIPDRWPRRGGGRGAAGRADGSTAAVIGPAALWISFVVPYTYVYDATVRKSARCSSAARVSLSPSSLWFNDRGPAPGHTGVLRIFAR